MIPLARPRLGETELGAVAEVLRSGMLVGGARVARFEAEVAERCGRAHAVAVSSGTSALELALRALSVGGGDRVLVPALTWPSPAHAAILCGATPVLVDVDGAEWNATGSACAAARDPRTRAAILIDQLGNPVRRDELEAALPGLLLIEDAACAIGSVFAGGSACGSLGVVSCLSFHPRKMLATGEGGMCLTDEPELADRMRMLRNHGQAAPGDFRLPAGNHRMPEVAAAIGLGQHARLDAMIAERRRIADRYRSELASTGVAFQQAPAGAAPNHQTIGCVLPEGAPDRDGVISAMAERGVQAGRLSYALSRIDPVATRSVVPTLPVEAERLADRGVALPVYEGMTDAEQGQVIAALGEVLGR